jgi:hypothetical protein
MCSSTQHGKSNCNFSRQLNCSQLLCASFVLFSSATFPDITEMLCGQQNSFVGVANKCRDLYGKKEFRKYKMANVVVRDAAQHFNPLNTKRRLLYLKTQFVPRSKHFSSGLQKPISLWCK